MSIYITFYTVSDVLERANSSRRSVSYSGDKRRPTRTTSFKLLTLQLHHTKTVRLLASDQTAYSAMKEDH